MTLRIGRDRGAQVRSLWKGEGAIGKHGENSDQRNRCAADQRLAHETSSRCGEQGKGVSRHEPAMNPCGTVPERADEHSRTRSTVGRLPFAGGSE
ncbi:MAG TPA: hypothetical protein VFX38_02985 [Gammaproteobacteria bacterium]|nr:hypothetical protein [Gammaproteobacteria bacterium]